MKKAIVLSMIVVASLANLSAASADIYETTTYAPTNAVGQSGAFSQTN